MLEIYIKLLPVFVFFILGVMLISFKVVPQKLGGIMLKFMFFVTLPAMILVKLTETPIDLDKFYLPFINIGINLGCMTVMLLFTWKMSIDRGTRGAMLVSSMIMNNLFIFPFVLTMMGDQAFTELVIFDIGNAFMTITLTYAVAFRHGPANTTLRIILINALKLPAVWALVVAILFNVNSIYFPALAIKALNPIGMLTSPLILIALGIYFTPKIKQIPLVGITIAVRMIFGILLGILFSNVFDLQGSTLIIVILCSAAPIGFNAVTYASLAKLDMELAATAVSFSILIGMITIPLLFYFLRV